MVERTGTRRWPWAVLAALLLLALGGAGGWLARGATTTAAAPPAPAVTVTVTPTSTVPPLPVAGPPIVPTTSTATADGPALGRGGDGARRGIGVVRPAEIDGGGERGLVTGISWTDWGSDRATGRGTALYRDEDEPDSAGVQDRATVVAFDLGDCDGDESYRRVLWYFPQHGQSFRESQAQELCD